MADAFVSFHARDVDPSHLNDVLSQYVAYERWRMLRRYLTLRVAAGLAIGWLSSQQVHLLPGMAFVAAGVAAVGILGAVVLAEQRARRIFTTFLCGSKVFKEKRP